VGKDADEDEDENEPSLCSLGRGSQGQADECPASESKVSHCYLFDPYRMFICTYIQTVYLQT
jgi:hypothetical protein